MTDVWFEVKVNGRETTGEKLQETIRNRFMIYGGMSHSIASDTDGFVSCSMSTSPAKVGSVIAWLANSYGEFSLTVQKWTD